MSEQHMYDLTGWVKVECAASDDIRAVARVNSSLTDLDGQYGEPVVYTEWALSNGIPILRDYRYPKSDRTCEHFELGGWDE